MIQTPKINLIHGDCMEHLRQTPDNHYQLAIVDPPYGININMNMGRRAGRIKIHKEKKWDSDIPEDDYFIELARVSENQIIWGGNYFPLPLTKSWIFWDKEVPAGVDFADGELAWTSFDKTLVKARLPYSGFRGSDNGGKIHPTQKPVALYKWLLTNYAKPGDRILDTHGGSMSIAIACFDLSFDLDLTELDKDYYDAGVARFERHRAQGQLFHAPATQLPEQQKMF